METLQQALGLADEKEVLNWARRTCNKYFSHLVDQTELDDLLSESLKVLVECYQQKNFISRATFKCYARLRIKGAGIDYLRKTKRYKCSSEDLSNLAARDLSPEQIYELKDKQDLVKAAIRHLRLKDQKLIIQRFVNDRTLAELARQFTMSSRGAVLKQLNRALRQLKFQILNSQKSNQAAYLLEKSDTLPDVA